MTVATMPENESDLSANMTAPTSAFLSAAVLAGSANPGLARSVERALDIQLAGSRTERFPDGELVVRVDDSVRGLDVVLLQPTSPPVNDNLIELLAMADACRRAAATRVVAVVPYFGYARSDRRDGRRMPIMSSLVADLMERAGISHVITLDVHTPSLEGFFKIAVDNLSAVPLLADALRTRISADAIIVAPDIGATRLANHYATLLDRPVAICHKQRTSGTEVSIARIIGDVAGRSCVIVDDMITTGGTIAESVRALKEAGATGNAIVTATHAVLVPGALGRMAAAGIRELVVTDTVALAPSSDSNAPAITVVSVAPLIATAIRRLLAGGSLRNLT
jgi:ribose-phosphate pyrophosphokinase